MTTTSICTIEKKTPQYEKSRHTTTTTIIIIITIIIITITIIKCVNKMQ